MTNAIAANEFSELDSKEMLNIDGGMNAGKCAAGVAVMIAAGVTGIAAPETIPVTAGIMVDGFIAAESACCEN